MLSLGEVAQLRVQRRANMPRTKRSELQIQHQTTNTSGEPMIVVVSRKELPDPSSLLLADPGQGSLLDRSVLVPSLV